MAMKPFCGYNFADYWAHWLSFERPADHLPKIFHVNWFRQDKIFHVNWFRQDKEGKFLWPGFGENLRVLRWIIDRCDDRVGAKETPIGFLPNDGDIATEGLDVSEETMSALLSIDIGQWRDEITMSALLSIDIEQWQVEMDSVGEYLEGFGERLPDELRQEHQRIVDAMNAVAAKT
jgi:phosphoenolpyruvate carboxykinase (GTP)